MARRGDVTRTAEAGKSLAVYENRAQVRKPYRERMQLPFA